MRPLLSLLIFISLILNNFSIAQAMPSGRNVALSAVADLSSSSSTQRGFTFSIRQNGFSIGVDGSDSNSNSKVYSNAVLAAARDSVIMAGQDIALAGANIRAKNVYLDAGRDLLVSSMQNLSTYNASNFGVGIGVTMAGNVPLPSFSVSGGWTTANRQYTDTPTTIIADEKLDAVVDRHTILAGSGMWSKTGKLKLDSGDLAFDNFQDSNHYNNWNFNAGFDAAALSSPTPWTALTGGFHRDYKNVNGITFATIGAGEIKIRNPLLNASGAPVVDLYNLNRDVGSMQRLIRSSSGNFGVPELNLLKVAEDIKGAARVLNALTANVPENVRLGGAQRVDQFQDLIIRGATREQAAAIVETEKFINLAEKRVAYLNAYNSAKTQFGRELSARELYTLSVEEQVGFDAGNLYIKLPCDLGPICGRINIDPTQPVAKEQIEALISATYQALADARAAGNVQAQVKAEHTLDYALQCALAWTREGGLTSQKVDLIFNPTNKNIWVNALSTGAGAANSTALFPIVYDSIQAGLKGDVAALNNLRNAAIVQQNNYSAAQLGGKANDARELALEIGRMMTTLQNGGSLLADDFLFLRYTASTMKFGGSGLVVPGPGRGKSYANSVLEASNSATISRRALTRELIDKGVTFTESAIVKIERMPDSRIVFLETGNADKGLIHITNNHGTQFVQNGISEAQIPSVLFQALRDNKIVGYQGQGYGRPIYETTVNGQSKLFAITVGSNGFIVGANPRTSP